MVLRPRADGAAPLSGSSCALKTLHDRIERVAATGRAFTPQIVRDLDRGERPNGQLVAVPSRLAAAVDGANTRTPP